MAVVALSTTDLLAYNITIGGDGTACPAVSGNTITATEDCSISVETIQTALASGYLVIDTDGDGNIYVNNEIEWSTDNSLYLDAFNNIYINKSITATNDNGKLALFYGRGAANANNTSDYFINAPINLKAGGNFITLLGSDGAMTTWTVVTTASDLQAITSGNFVLGGDVDASGIANWTPIGIDWDNRFQGIVDGLGHTVSNLTINNSGVSYQGLFGWVENATIQNLGLVDSTITGGENTGSLIGFTDTVTLNNVFSNANVNGLTSIGGLIGQTANTNIYNSYHNANVTGTYMDIGGLVGYINGTTLIENSYAKGILSAGNYNGDSNIGGLVGGVYGTLTINNSYAESTVTGTGNNVGGLVGYDNDVVAINKSYAKGTITGVENVGGLVGFLNGGGSTISNSYFSGSVTGTTNVGGLTGTSNGYISKSYAIGTVTGDASVGGLIGFMDYRTITDSYASNIITFNDSSTFIGGLVGKYWDSGSSYVEYNNAEIPEKILNSYYDNEVNTGTMGDSSLGIMSTTELQSLSTYTNAGWDIETYTATENTYPTLAWQESGNTYTKTWIIGQKSLLDINISNSTLAENNSADAIIGTLSTINSDTGDTFTYSLCGGTDDASFSISGSELQANAVFDYESKNSYEVCVRTTDSANAIFDKTFTISITNVNEMPSISSTATTSVDENSAYSYTLGASDADGDSLTWSVKSGINLPSWLSLNNDPTVSTFAGSSSGFADGVGVDALFDNPHGVAVDSNNNIYVADYDNNKIRKITPEGVVSTFAGSGDEGSADGVGVAASFDSPRGIVIDSDNNFYIADTGNDKIRKITPDGNVTTFAGSGWYDSTDGVGTAAAFKTPSEIAIDSDNNLYVADTFNHKIRKITSDGNVTTFAGSGTANFADGVGAAAQFSQPFGVVVDSKDNIYVADKWNNKIRKITPDGNVSTFAGSGNQSLDDGVGAAASFYRPGGMAIDSNDNIYVADTWNNSIRKITPDANVTTLAGIGNDAYGFLDGFGTKALFANPTGITIDTDNNIYVADYGNHKIRKITQKVALIGTPSASDIGDHNISLVLSDGTNEVEHNFTITVNCVTNCGGGSTGGGTTPQPTPQPEPTPEPEPEEPVVVVPEPTPEPDPTPDPEPTPEPEVSHELGDVTATSELEGTTTQTDPSTGDITTSTTTTNDSDEDIDIEVVAKADGEVKAIHSLKVGTKETKAESELSNTKTTIKADKSVETSATLSENGSEIKVIAKSDGSASHEVKLSDSTTSQATSDIKGAQTYITQEGEVQTSVEAESYVDANGCTVKAVVLTDKDGESRSEFVKVCNGQEAKQPTVSETTPFEAGNTIRVYEDAEDANKLKLKIKTPVTKRLQF